MSNGPPRLASLDVLRGLTVLVMLFVNDIGGVQGTPAWLRHFHPGTADGMTLVDAVFPTFLFLVGMSLPFALGRRRERGEPLPRLLGHVLTRSLALLVLGVFMVNADGLPFSGSSLGWTLLLYLGAFLTFHQRHGRPVSRSAGGIGVLLLLTAALAFRSPEGSGWLQLRPQWWGILGLIGWAYLAGALVTLILGRSAPALLGTMALAYLFALADGLGQPPLLDPLRDHLSLGPLFGTHAGIVLGGAFLGHRLADPTATPRTRLQAALGLALGLALAGWLLHALAPLHRVFQVSKVMGTPAWGLFGGAAASALWALTYTLVDLRGLPAGWLARLGTRALTVYLAAPALFALLGLLGWLLAGHDVYTSLSAHPLTGTLRTVAFLALATGLVLGAERRGWGLQL